jgi:hypothetical protein
MSYANKLGLVALTLPDDRRVFVRPSAVRLLYESREQGGRGRKFTALELGGRDDDVVRVTEPLNEVLRRMADAEGLL